MRLRKDEAPPCPMYFSTAVRFLMVSESVDASFASKNLWKVQGIVLEMRAGQGKREASVVRGACDRAVGLAATDDDCSDPEPGDDRTLHQRSPLSIRSTSRTLRLKTRSKAG